MPAVNEIAPIYADEGGDEDLYLPKQRQKKDTRSKLMRSKAAAAGLIVNACPFGCEDHQLDEQTYCKHMVGTTDPDDDRIFFPMKWRDDVQTPGVKRFRFIDGSDPQMVQKTDVLVRITTCSRVYRDTPAQTKPTAATPPAK